MFPMPLLEEEDKFTLMPATDSGIIILKDIRDEDEEYVELWDRLNPLPLPDQLTGI